jgi:hypothetical protein
MVDHAHCKRIATFMTEQELMDIAKFGTMELLVPEGRVSDDFSV